MIAPVSAFAAVLLTATGPLAEWSSCVWRVLGALLPEFRYEEGELASPDEWPTLVEHL